MQDSYATPWLQDQPQDSSSWLDAMGQSPDQSIYTAPTDPTAPPTNVAGGGGINEAAPLTAGASGSPWLEGNAPGAQQLGNPTPAAQSAPGTVPATAAPGAQREIDMHSMADSLTADGHDVSWNAQGQLVVDGRPYDTAGNDMGQPTVEGTGPAAAAGGGGSANPLDPNNQPSAVGVGAPGNATNAINGFYQKWMGRAPESADVVQQYINSGKSLSEIENLIANSAEAKAYAAAHPGATAPAGPGGDETDDALDMEVPQWLKDMVPGYTPTLMDTSLSELPDFKTLFDSAMGDNPNGAALDKLVGQILEHPESLNDHDLETLKARAAEEAAVASQANDEDLLHFAANSNLGDSPWLASARQANSQARRNTTIQSNQNLDIAAADRRASDKRSAAALGITAGNARSARSQAATSTALSGVLAKTNMQTTRAQLNESFKQAATELGLSSAALATNYVLGHAGIQIDEAKFKSQSDQWKQDLALKIAQLKQQSDQFDAELQLEMQKFQHGKDNDAWAKAQAAYAA
jgi:hypothetical protein